MSPLTRVPNTFGAPASGLTPDNYKFLQEFVHHESGIVLDGDKRYLLEARLMPVASSLKLPSLEELCGHLRRRPSPELRRQVVEAMTTHETLFFRDAAVFDMLKNSLLPEVIAARQGNRTLRIWSAACSSGQEPYSLAMMLMEMGLESWDIRILATDLSLQILERARKGLYLQIEVNRGLPVTMLVKHFTQSGTDWQIKDHLRKMIRWEALDLRQSLKAIGPFDLVLCRNVMIYFDIETKKTILGGIRNTLVPGGHLVLGSSETTLQLDAAFEHRPFGRVTAYRRT